MIGWFVASLLLGLIAGVILAWYLLPRAGLIASAPAPVRQTPVISEPPEPEEIAQAIITSEIKERMVQDFMRQDGLSEADARLAAEDIVDRTHQLGAQMLF